MKNYELRLKKLESLLLPDIKYDRCLKDSMILERDEPIPYEKIIKMKRNSNPRIYVIPTFGGKHKIVAY